MRAAPGRLWRLLWLALGLLAVGAVGAHKASDAYLSLVFQGPDASGRWDIALRDLDFALGLDADGNGEITWGELRARQQAIADYAGARLMLNAGGQPCALRVGAQQVMVHDDGAYAVLPLQVKCAQSPGRLRVEYRLFADTDPLHRGLLELRLEQAERTAVLDPQAEPTVFEVARRDPFADFGRYLVHGAWQLWLGFGHLLFLLSLLLPSVLVWRSRPEPGWRPATRVAPVSWDVLRIVAAFTVAHSITRACAILGWVQWPSRTVEAAIAASVVLVALNNVVPLLHERRWMVAFGLGLVHGLGLAGALAQLGLPPGTRAPALLGFHVGIQLGQLATVALFVPLAYLMRRRELYRRLVLVGGSCAIASLATLWFVERAFDLALLGR
jgi:hypothetical protein